jgi:hypothetical protein
MLRSKALCHLHCLPSTIAAHGRSEPKGYGTENPKPIQSAKKWFGSPVVLKAVTKNGLVLMKRNTRFAAFAVFGFLAGSSVAIPEQSNGTGPVLLHAPRGQAPVPVIKPIQEDRISRQIRLAPAPGDAGAGQDPLRAAGHALLQPRNSACHTCLHFHLPH